MRIRDQVSIQAAQNFKARMLIQFNGAGVLLKGFQMQEAITEENYERASKLRDEIRSIEEASPKKKK